MSRRQVPRSNSHRKSNKTSSDNITASHSNDTIDQDGNEARNEQGSGRLSTRQSPEGNLNWASQSSQLSHSGSSFPDSDPLRSSPVAGGASPSSVANNNVAPYNYPSTTYGLAPPAFFHDANSHLSNCGYSQADETVVAHSRSEEEEAATSDFHYTRNLPPTQTSRSYRHNQYNLNFGFTTYGFLPNPASSTFSSSTPSSHINYPPTSSSVSPWNFSQLEQGTIASPIPPSNVHGAVPGVGPITQPEPVNTTDENTTAPQGRRQYPCTQCPNVYPKRNRAKACENKHAGVRPFVCDGSCGNPKCDKAFYGSECLSKHTSKNRFVNCEFCGKKGYRRNYKRHLDSCKSRPRQ